MSIQATSAFLQSLTSDTLEKRIVWKSLNCLKGVSENSNKALYYALFENEFHSILFSKSFYCLLPSSGYVYLINETFESGYDGTITSGISVYIQKDSSSQLHQLIVDLSNIYQLENAITDSFIEEDEAIQQFIDSYYNT